MNKDKSTVEDLRNTLTLIKHDYTLTRHESDYGHESFCRILDMIDWQNHLFEKIIDHIEKLETK